jgi:hypothetical protein
MVVAVLISVMAPLMPTAVLPVLPMFAFARPNVVVLRARYVHRLLLNPHLDWFAIDWYLNAVDDGTAALHTLGGVAWLGRHTLTDHCACYRANGGGCGTAVPMADLVAEQTSGNASNDCAAGVVATLLYLNLFVPALLARTFNRLIFGCKGRHR